MPINSSAPVLHSNPARAGAAAPWEALQRGERWRGRVDTGIAELPPVPVLAARGKLDGLRVAVFGAVHGDEYEGTAAIHTLFEALTPDDLDELGGLLVGVPVANGAAWAARRRTTPQDGLDLNRSFPGAEAMDAPITHRLAYFLFQTFIAPADVVIDLHSGGVRLMHVPMVGWGAGSEQPSEDGVAGHAKDPAKDRATDQATDRAEALTRIFGLDFYPWQVGATAGVLTHEATRAGKIALGAEWGGGGSLDRAGMGAYAEGLRRLWHALGPSAPWSYEMDTRPPLVGDYAATPVGGIFHPAVHLGAQVEKGAPLGVVVDDLGEELAVLASERSGMIAGLAHLGRIEAGERFVYVG